MWSLAASFYPHSTAIWKINWQHMLLVDTFCVVCKNWLADDGVQCNRAQLHYEVTYRYAVTIALRTQLTCLCLSPASILKAVSLHNSSSRLSTSRPSSLKDSRVKVKVGDRDGQSIKGQNCQVPGCFLKIKAYTRAWKCENSNLLWAFLF